MICRHYRIEGRVQGVGFRYFTSRTARRLALSGWVRNCFDGTVEAQAYGSEADLDAFEAELQKGPSFSRVTSVSSHEVTGARETGEFRITY